MGSIREVSLGRTRLLEPEYAVGRSPMCALRFQDEDISAHHAVLRWTGTRWELRDLGSRRGTFLDGARLRPGEAHPLDPGARIAFGVPQHEWELVDDSPPRIMVVCLDSADPEPLLMEGEVLALPSIHDPRAIIRRADGSWVLERPGESIAPINNHQTFDVSGRMWRFCCTDEMPDLPRVGTPTSCLEVRDVHLSFYVSMNEEYVRVQMRLMGRTFDMGSRGFNYLLLTLARRRMEDAATGLGQSECGWIDQEDFSHDPSMQPPRLNLDVFRIRKHFAAAGVTHARDLIERRRGQLRLGTGNVCVSRM